MCLCVCVHVCECEPGQEVRTFVGLDHFETILVCDGFIDTMVTSFRIGVSDRFGRACLSSLLSLFFFLSPISSLLFPLFSRLSSLFSQEDRSLVMFPRPHHPRTGQ